MYVEFTAYCDENGEIKNPETERKISELSPHIDEWITYSLLSGEDENGEYMCYSYGENDFYDDDGVTELEGGELESAENSNHADALQVYIALYPLLGDGIIDLWINDGSQFGRRPSIEAAKSEMDSLSVIL